MAKVEDVWRLKSDDELSEAAKSLAEYTPDGEDVIRAELRRRGMPEPGTVPRPGEVNREAPKRSRRELQGLLVFVALAFFLIGVYFVRGLPYGGSDMQRTLIEAVWGEPQSMSDGARSRAAGLCFILSLLALLGIVVARRPRTLRQPFVFGLIGWTTVWVWFTFQDGQSFLAVGAGVTAAVIVIGAVAGLVSPQEAV